MNSEHAQRVNFDEIKRIVPLAAILERYGILPELKRVGTQLFGVCPIHHGTHKKQFVVDPAKSLWKCFGDCQHGGSTLEFVAAMENVSIIEAARLIAGWYAIGPNTQLVNHRNQKRTTAMNDRPSHKCYVVDDKDGEENDEDSKGWWTRVGSAWPHKDGKGLNVLLAAVPTNGRLVLREYTETDAKADEQRKVKRKK